MLERERITAELPLHEPRPPSAPLALAGVRVADFTHFLAGPLATQTMGDMGADVIKVENPTRGDEFRHYPPMPPGMDAQGAPFMWTNRSKRSLGLDLKSPEGRQVALELIASADVLVENYSTGVMGRFGLDYETCRKINPRLIYASVSAYGQEGPYSDRVGFDPIAQAESGFISMNGYPDRQGVRTLSPVVDISTALTLCNAILGALLARHRTNEGQRIEVTLFDTALMMTGYAAMQQIYTGKEPVRHGNTSPDTCPSGVFMAKDKPFYVNCGSDKIYQRLAGQVLERPDLANDPVLSQRNGRLANRQKLFAILEELFAEQPWAFWSQRMRAASVPCGEVRTLGEALRSPEARYRKMVSRIPHPHVGWLPNIASPIRFSGTPMADPRPAPSVGEHSDEILRETMGYDDARIAALRAAGVLGEVAAPASGEHMFVKEA